MSEEEQGKAALAWMRKQAKELDKFVDDSYSVSDLARIISANITTKLVKFSFQDGEYRCNKPGSQEGIYVKVADL